MSDLVKALLVIDEGDCEHRPHVVVPWIGKAAARILALEATLSQIADGVAVGDECRRLAEIALGDKK